MTTAGTLHAVSLAQRPDLEEPMITLEAAWPAYIAPDPLVVHWAFDRHAEHQLVFLDEDRVVARAASVPFAWDGDPATLSARGWDDALRRSMTDTYTGRELTALCALEIAVAPDATGRRLSGRVLRALLDHARDAGFRDLVAPVRPSRKHLEPDLPIHDYLARVRADGLPEDPWLRVHAREGGQLLRVCPVSMTITADLAQWRAWTGLPFDATGPVLVPGGLTPVHADVERDFAVYVEPNSWVRHRLDTPRRNL
ncbi:MAG TPA: N-acetyltransferase [Umezawaea sp.]|nr:N-acetyltransferase [Umezawaea sp.]